MNYPRILRPFLTAAAFVFTAVTSLQAGASPIISSIEVTVPDGGITLILLGISVSALVYVARRRKS